MLGQDASTVVEEHLASRNQERMSPSKVLWVDVPGNVCNLNCEYCYVGSQKGGSPGKFPHSIDYTLKCFAPSRFGGPVFFGGASGGETLLTKDIVPFTEGLLSYGHIVSYTTNMTVRPVLKKFCQFPANLRSRLELDASLHYLELKRLNRLDEYFENLNMLRDADISIAIFLVISDQYIPHLREISDLCQERIGLLPIAGMMRDYDKGGGRLGKVYKKAEDRAVKETCDVRQWELQRQLYGHKREEFCYAGQCSINVSLANGAYRKCWNHGHLGNIYANPDEAVRFEAVGKCPFYDCVCASYQCWGLIPELNVPTHSRTYFTKHSVSEDVWSFVDSKVGQRKSGTKCINTPDIRVLSRTPVQDKTVQCSDAEEPGIRKADWDSLWKGGFKYGVLDAWAKDIFITIVEILKDIEKPRILSAGCGRGLIDYWLVKVFGYHATLLDNSEQCIVNLEHSFSVLDKSRYRLCHGSILDIPFSDGTFDLVWNEGVLEHFGEQEYYKALSEMRRVSKKFVLVDVPNANCKPYMLSKQWLEEKDMWAWGCEKPRTSLRSDFEASGMRVLVEKPIGDETTIRNYINMVPTEHRSVILNQLNKTDYEVFPHLLVVGQVNRSTDRKQAGQEDGYYRGPEKQEVGTFVNRNICSAEDFLKGCIRDGLAHSYDVKERNWIKPYPEATAYLLSYFANDVPSKDVPRNVIAAADKLVALQDKCGGFTSFCDRHFLYTFDTGQIMHGLASIFKKKGDRKYLDAALAGAEFVCGMQLPDGSMFPIYDLRYGAKYVDKNGSWGSNFSYIQAKNIEGLLLLFELTAEPRYKAVAERLAYWARQNCDLTFTHPGAYCLEGLLAMGEMEFVRNQLRERMLRRIRSNGFLAYSKDLPYSYVSGSVQMGILLFKTGFREESRRILEWARIVQSNHSMGGLFQYADKDGQLDTHVHTEMNSWGTRYHAQLERLWL